MIYTRTGKGDEEVSARRPGLDAKLNSILFLVDGKRTRDDINALAERLGSPADSIDRLVDGGYVRTLEKPAARPAASGTVNNRNGDAPSAVVATHSQADSALQSILYQHLITAAKQYLGVRGFLFHLKIEKATDLPELRALIKPMGEAIAKSRGLATANSFIEETEALVQADD
jgi:hypothetical protein